MKKVLLFLLICVSILSASAQDVTTKTTTVTTASHDYLFYPAQNVYFEKASGNYWYLAPGSDTWTMTQTLPPTIVVEKTVQYPITYVGTDPWKNNIGDIKKYKVKKNGTIKIKKIKKDD
jgi:hypothetical protein